MREQIWLTREWVPAATIRDGLDLSAVGVKRRLARLHSAGVLDRKLQGNGTPLWRLSDRYIALLVKAGRR